MMKNFFLLIFLIFSFVFHSNAQTENNLEELLVVFLVRHAEKVDNSRDPELSEAGKERAVELAETLSSSTINNIYSTDYIRTRRTALPTANLFEQEVKLYDPKNLEEFASQIKNRKGRYLIVGHSNTTPRLVEHLGGIPSAPIVEKNEYDRLYILTITDDGGVNTVLLRYGEKFKVTDND